MEKIFRSRSKAEEKEDLKLYDFLKDDISEIREHLKLMYVSEKNGLEDRIHTMVVRLDRIKYSLASYIFDGELARRILEERNRNHKNLKKERRMS